MIVGRTASNAIKIKTDGTTRAVNCACCGPKCYPTPFNPSDYILISEETGNNIFNRNISITMGVTGIGFDNQLVSLSSGLFTANYTDTGFDCRYYSGYTRTGVFPDSSDWGFNAYLYRVNGNFYFNYQAEALTYKGLEPIIVSYQLTIAPWVPQLVESTSTTLIGTSIFSSGGNVNPFTQINSISLTIT